MSSNFSENKGGKRGKEETRNANKLLKDEEQKKKKYYYPKNNNSKKNPQNSNSFKKNSQNNNSHKNLQNNNSKMNLPNQRVLGGKYESMAAEHLEELGYQILERNIYTPYGEVDILAEQSGRFYFFEVKYRSSAAYGSPKAALTKTKLRNMKRSMLYLIKERNYHSGCKLAFVGITMNAKKPAFEVLCPLVF